jgi:hypothetical protein
MWEGTAVLIQRSPRVVGPRRASVLAAVVAAGGALLAGCGAGPNQVGSSVIVGEAAVSLSATEHRVDEALAQPNLVDSVLPSVVSGLVQHDPNNPKYQNLTPDQQRSLTQALLARVIVTKQVQHVLLAEAARRDGITVTPEQVSAGLAIPGMAQQLAENGLAFDPATLRETMQDLLTAQALAVREMDRLSITVDEVAVSSKDQAIAAARALAAGGAQAANALRAAGQNARGGVRMTAVQAAQSGSTFLLGTPAGQVVAAYAGQDSWGVWRVTRRDSNGPPSAGLDAVAQLDADGLQAVGIQLLQPLAEQLGVRVNPRYGIWDTPNLLVLGPDQPVSIVLPASVS